MTVGEIEWVGWDGDSREGGKQNGNSGTTHWAEGEASNGGERKGGMDGRILVIIEF